MSLSAISSARFREFIDDFLERAADEVNAVTLRLFPDI
jgi:hypothetical protein